MLLAGLSLTGCLQSDSSNQEQTPQAGPRIGELRLADCTDWRRADVRERYGTIRDLRAFSGGPVGASPGGHGAVLDDKKAYKLFESYCKKDFAARFKLYRLYNRAAAFGSGGG